MLDAFHEYMKSTTDWSNPSDALSELTGYMEEVGFWDFIAVFLEIKLPKELEDDAP